MSRSTDGPARYLFQAQRLKGRQGQLSPPIIEVTRDDQWRRGWHGPLNPGDQMRQLSKAALVQKSKMHNKQIEGLGAIPNYGMQHRPLLKGVIREILGLHSQDWKLRQQGIAVMTVKVVRRWSVYGLMVSIREKIVL